MPNKVVVERMSHFVSASSDCHHSTRAGAHADTQRSWDIAQIASHQVVGWIERANQVSACQARALLKFPLERRILLVRLKVDTATRHYAQALLMSALSHAFGSSEGP